MRDLLGYIEAALNVKRSDGRAPSKPTLQLVADTERDEKPEPAA